MSDQLLLVMFVGIPGSGKTTFTRQLAEQLNAVILGSDSLRIWMWGSRESIPSSQDGIEQKRQANMLTFGAMNYATNQILAAGKSVIYDCNANHLAERQEKYKIAKDHGARAVVVRIEVPYEVSLERVQQREDAHDQRQMSLDQAKRVLQRFTDELEEPTNDEPMIVIDGQQPFSRQYDSFCEQLNP